MAGSEPLVGGEEKEEWVVERQPAMRLLQLAKQLEKASAHWAMLSASLWVKMFLAWVIGLPFAW